MGASSCLLLFLLGWTNASASVAMKPAIVAEPVANTSSELWGRQLGSFSFPGLAAGAVLVPASSAAGSSELLVFRAFTGSLALHVNTSTPVSTRDSTLRIAALGDASLATVGSNEVMVNAILTFAATASDSQRSLDGVFITSEGIEALPLVTTEDTFRGASFTAFASVASAILERREERATSADVDVLATFSAETVSWQGLMAAEQRVSSSSVVSSAAPSLQPIVSIGDPIPGAPQLDFLCVSSPQASPRGEITFFGSHCRANAAASSAIAAQRIRRSFFRTRSWQTHCLTRQATGLGRAEVVDHVFPGIYRWRNANRRSEGRAKSTKLTTVADSSSGVPGGVKGEVFEAFSSPAMGPDGTVAFVGLGSNGTMGVFAQSSKGQLRAVATTLSTGSGGFEFGDFPTEPSVGADGRVVFYAVSAATALGGVYSETTKGEGIALQTLITESSSIGGQSIIYIGFGTGAANAGMDAGALAAIYLVLGNGTDGIWTLRRPSYDLEAGIAV